MLHLFIALLLCASVAHAEPALVGMREGTSWPDEYGQARKLNGISVWRVEESEQSPDEMRSNPDVEFVEEDSLQEPDRTPNDPLFSDQWHHATIRSAAAWDRSISASSVVIAIADTGVDPVADLAAKLVAGFNTGDDNLDTEDVCGHGTSVAGTAAAHTDNGLGVAGVAWLARIMPVRIVAEGTCFARISDMADAVTGAADRDVDIVNMSFSGIHASETMRLAARYAWERDTIFVASAGNTGRDETWAESPYIVAVGATGRSDEAASFTSRGVFVDLSAPGVGILATNRDGTFGGHSGTSFSAPVVAGVLGLMRSAFPLAGPDELVPRLIDATVDLGAPGYDTTFGAGRVDAALAVGSIAAPTPTPTRRRKHRTPTPLPTRVATVTPTRVPTALPTRTPTRIATSTPRPTATRTPVPTVTPTPCATILGVRICL